MTNKENRTPGNRPNTSESPHYYRFFMVAAAVLLFDQVSKQWIVRQIPYPTYFFDSPSPPITIIQNFWYIVHIGNPGAAWGMLSGYGWLLATLAALTVLAIFFFRKSLGLKRRMHQYTFGLLVGGILGNLLDRLLYGHVVDFIDIHLPPIELLSFGGYRWPAFNVADSAITCGVVLFIFLSLFEKESAGEK